jgi:hypothetical protein
MQTKPTAQAAPQLPQFAGSVDTSVQLPAHVDWPVGQLAPPPSPSKLTVSAL